ncbi:hypothetical protein FRC10_010070 [Ceratobasidium sp. 414]|nr:hypothetical protein FRC10_010070 [Ceratobasidium sp. 414]
MMTADLAQAIGGIMSVRWVAAHHISIGHFCTAQAAIKQFADVGTAVWSAVIAIHTFRLLFFNSHTSHVFCFVTLAIAWSGIITIVAVGPTVIESSAKGDYFGISGELMAVRKGTGVGLPAVTQLRDSCLNTSSYMFVSAFISLVVYTMIFFRLRGNLIAEGYKIRILSVTSSRAWNLEAGRAVMESNTMTIAWQLMWYPVSYAILVSVSPDAPALSLNLWAEFSGSQVPFPVKMFASVVFMLSGFVNTVLFIATRHVLPPIKLRRKSMSSSAPQGISISVHATRTQHVSSANGEPSYVISLPAPKSTQTGAQIYELEDCSRFPPVPEKSEGRLSGESIGASFAGTGKVGYDIEDGSVRGPPAV